MRICFIKAAALIAALGLVLAGCENPEGGDPDIPVSKRIAPEVLEVLEREEGEAAIELRNAQNMVITRSKIGTDGTWTASIPSSYKGSEITIVIVIPAGDEERIFKGGTITIDSGGNVNVDFAIISIGVAIYKYEDDIIANARDAIITHAQDKAFLEVVDSKDNQDTQNNQVNAFLSKKYGAMVINLVDTNEAGKIIDKAKDGNTPVVFFGREPPSEDMEKWDKVYYVGLRAEDAGTMQGEIVVDYWKANPAADKNGDKVIQYIMLKGISGHPDAELRTEFSIKAIEAAGLAVVKLAEDTADWNPDNAEDIVANYDEDLLNQIELVLCNNDGMALGAINALKEKGFFSSHETYIPVVGVDATAPALDALSEGTLLGTVLNDTENLGKAAFDLAYALAAGQPASAAGWTLSGKKVWVPYQKVTQDNYEQFQ